MTPCQRRNSERQYDITVRSARGTEEVYRTLQLLACPERYRPKSRGTRVWKAVRLENGEPCGEPVVLKQAWVDVTREREGTMHTNILQAALSEECQSSLQDSLLTTLTHGDVFVAGRQDCTRRVPVDDTDDVDDAESASDLADHTASYVSSTKGRVTSWWSSTIQQVYYRAVYKEIGVPLHHLSSLKTVFSVLAEACKSTCPPILNDSDRAQSFVGLDTLHNCGWVHGDVSPANILLVGDRTKIIDLEYAVRKEDIREHDKVVSTRHRCLFVRLLTACGLRGTLRPSKFQCTSFSFSLKKRTL